MTAFPLASAPWHILHFESKTTLPASLASSPLARAFPLSKNNVRTVMLKVTKYFIRNPPLSFIGPSHYCPARPILALVYRAPGGAQDSSPRREPWDHASKTNQPLRGDRNLKGISSSTHNSIATVLASLGSM